MGCGCGKQPTAKVINSSEKAGVTKSTKSTDFVRTAELLGKGAVKLISAKWLLKQAPDFIMIRCQDMPIEAVVPAAAAAEFFRESSAVSQQIVVLSYPWLSNAHPDPSGFHLQRVLKYLKSYLLFSRLEDVGVFWDFASMPQAPRSEQDNEVFKLGLKLINLLYGSQQTSVIQLKVMPPCKDNESLNLLEYSQRGWCTVEERISGIMKNTVTLLDLSRADDLVMWGASWLQVRDAAIVARQPPMLPSALSVLLESKSFTSHADKSIVESIYASFFQESCATVESLFFSDVSCTNPWSACIEELAVVLPDFKSCKRLYLQNHNFTDNDIARLAPSLSSMPLEHLILGGNSFGSIGIDGLQDVVKIGSLRLLQLPLQARHSEAGNALTKTWQSLGKNAAKLVWSDEPVSISVHLEEACSKGTPP